MTEIVKTLMTYEAYANAYLSYADNCDELVYRLLNVVNAFKKVHKKIAWKDLAKIIVAKLDRTEGNGYETIKRYVEEWTDFCLECNSFTLDGKPSAGCKDRSSIREVLTNICQWRDYDRLHHTKHDWAADFSMIEYAVNSLDLNSEKACKSFVRSFLSLYKYALA